MFRYRYLLFYDVFPSNFEFGGRSLRAQSAARIDVVALLYIYLFHFIKVSSGLPLFFLTKYNV